MADSLVTKITRLHFLLSEERLGVVLPCRWKKRRYYFIYKPLPPHDKKQFHLLLKLFDLHSSSLYSSFFEVISLDVSRQ